MLVAVDTGATKTLVATFSKDGELKTSVKFPTPQDTTEYTSHLAAKIIECLAGETAAAIVIAVPGMVSGNKVVWCPNLGWEDFAIVDALKSHFDVEIMLENDANLAGLAEARSLDPAPPSLLYITISTGIGSGVVLHGRIDPALRNSEAGHAVVEYGGASDEWENFAAGSAIYRTYGQYARDITSNDTWREIADRISRGLLAVVPTLQPDVIVFGGSIGTFFEKYSAELEQILDQKLPKKIVLRPRLLQAAHPEEAVIYGCYYYAIDQPTA